jgi:uncharacterized membrane protein YeiH
METLLLMLDLVGTFVFALSGATAGVKHRADLFGVLVLSYAAGNAGGITRDLLIGAGKTRHCPSRATPRVRCAPTRRCGCIV